MRFSNFGLAIRHLCSTGTRRKDVLQKRSFQFTIAGSLAIALLVCGSFAWAQKSSTTHHPAPSSKEHSGSSHKSHHHAQTHSTSSKSHHTSSARKVHHSGKHVRRRPSARELAKMNQLHRAFIASSQLRPMAQQLMTERSPQAYAGVP